MKKIIIILLLSCLITTVGFTLSETFISVGYENENHLEFDTSKNTETSDQWSYMNSSGVNIKINQFWNGKKIGLFVQQSFLAPTSSKVVNGNERAYYLTVKDFDMMFKYNLIVGPAFRFSFKEKFNLNLGAGFSFSYLTANLGTRYAQNRGIINYGLSMYKFYYMGLGVNLDFNYDVTDIMHIGFGSIFNFKFYRHQTIENPVESYSFPNTSDWFGLGIKPYIYIGFNFYNNNVNMGKPK